MPIVNQINLTPALDSLKADLLADIAAKHVATQDAVATTGAATQSGVDDVLSAVGELPLSPVKSVQRGDLELSGNSPHVVPISAIDPAKSFVNARGRKDGTTIYEAIFTVKIKSPAELEFTMSSNNVGQISWEVIEYV